MNFLMPKISLNFAKSQNLLSRTCLPALFQANGDLFFQQKRGAKRKGLRIKAQLEKRKRATQRKLEEKSQQKKVWVPPSLRIDTSKLGVKTRSYDDKNLLPLPSDDVFHTEGFRQIAYSLEEAIAFHRETHHPTMFNKSNALIEAAVELDMRTKKKTKFVSEFSGILMFPHKFEIKTSRRIVAICKTLEQSDIAIQSGASIAGGSDIIRQIKSKKLTSTDFDHIVCHSDMLVELAEVRGVLRDHFPNKVKGNYGTDMQTLVTKFMESLDYKCTRDDIEPEFGCVESPFGSLDMDTDKLRENLIYFLNKVESHQPKDAPSCFIRRVLLKSKPSLEQFRIRHWDLLDGYEDPTQIDESEMKSGQKG